MPLLEQMWTLAVSVVGEMLSADSDILEAGLEILLISGSKNR